ncbi:MAG: hypothetical protein PUE12_08310 [Oscillospiraceae bacterium]|nr:hypothetical protein [Oscillospiraceae bacterium]
MKTIITQDGVVALNYDNAVKMLYHRPTEAEDVDTGETKSIFAIAAVIHDETDPLVLGFYETKERTQEVFGQLIACISSDTTAGFVMPD